MNPSDQQYSRDISSLESGSPARTALVLGGGGATGNAWLIGVVAGLHEAGVDVAQADVIIGTSAGATAAAQLVGTDPLRLLADIRAASEAADAPVAAASVPSAAGAATSAVAVQLERSMRLINASRDIEDMRRRFGVAAVELAAAHDHSERWHDTVATRFVTREWPHKRMLITAVDARTGEPVVFDRDSGVDLVDAVAASCSSGPAYRIGERRFIDGGFRTNADNADLAAGYGRVLVLSPLGGHTLTPAAWGLDLAAQTQRLRAQGSEVEVVVPNPEAEHLFGANAMNLSLRGPAAEAGREQGVALADVVREWWR